MKRADGVFNFWLVRLEREMKKRGVPTRHGPMPWPNNAFSKLALSLAIASILSSCASLPVAHSTYPIIRALPKQPGDDALYFDAKNYKFLLWEGAPASLFTLTPRGWRLDRLDFVQAATAINRKENGK